MLYLKIVRGVFSYLHLLAEQRLCINCIVEVEI